MINTLKELKFLTSNLTNFSKIDILDINSGIISHLPQEQKNALFVKKAKLIHGDKYNYSKTKRISSNRNKIEIICPVHGSFWQIQSYHLDGCGCQKCGGSKKLTIQDFIQKATKVHGDKYDYSKTNYINASTKVEIICPTHGSFDQTPSGHLYGYGYIKCSDNKLTTEQFIEKAVKIHGNKYDYSKINYIGIFSKVEVVCPIHGSFWQVPYSHIRNSGGSGCSKCEKYSNEKLTIDSFVEKAIKLHGNVYNYSKITNIKNSITKVEIICPLHNSFFQTPSNHLNGSGCSKCNNSHGEREILNFLTKNNTYFETEWNFNKHPQLKGTGTSYLQFDFYLPNYNLAIEYDGAQHFKPVEHWGGHKGLSKTQRRDQIKNQFCLDNNIKLIRIPYWVKLTEELILHHLNKNFTMVSAI